MPDQDFTYSQPGAASNSALPISIFADDPAIRAELRADADAAGFEPGWCGPVAGALAAPAEPLASTILLHVEALCPAQCDQLRALDERMAAERCRVIASTAPEALDDLYGCLAASRPQILVAPSAQERLVALGVVKAMQARHRVRELDAADRETLLRLTEQVGQIAAQLDRISAGAAPVFRLGDAADPASGAEQRMIRAARPPLPDPRLVRRIVRQRRLRARFFGEELFADPAWDILLDLTAARAEHARASVTSLCIASGVPPTTALRWIGQMVDAGLLERVEDDADRRRVFIRLADRAADAMARYFAELGRDGPALI